MNCVKLSYIIWYVEWNVFDENHFVIICDDLAKGFIQIKHLISANQTVWYGTELNYCLSESKNYLITVNATCVLWVLINDWQLPS